MVGDAEWVLERKRLALEWYASTEDRARLQEALPGIEIMHGIVFPEF
jgi:hypothetical protein